MIIRQSTAPNQFSAVSVFRLHLPDMPQHFRSWYRHLPGHQQHHFFIPTEYRTGKTNLSHHGNDQHRHCKTRIPLADKTISCKCFTTRLFTLNITLHHQRDSIFHQPVRSCAYRKAFQFIFLLPILPNWRTNHAHLLLFFEHFVYMSTDLSDGRNISCRHKNKMPQSCVQFSIQHCG